jgi:transcriptional adapter 3
MASRTAYLDILVGSLMIPANVLYDDILERHGGSGGIPDPKHLEALASDLKTLSSLAESRTNACDGGMRMLVDRRKQTIEEERELEQANRDAEEKASLKRAAEDDDLEKSGKAGKLKKRKDRGSVLEERPLAHGAHGVARQDGIGLDAKSESSKFARVLPASPIAADAIPSYGSTLRAKEKNQMSLL